jgi:hypothetical protein
VAPAYLVAFVADPPCDAHADALRAVARRVAGAGFFDDADDGPHRTVGTFVRTEAPWSDAAMALLAAVGEMSAEHAVRVEVQFAEEVLGLIDDGRPDAALRQALRGGPGGGTPGASPAP